MMGGRLGEGKVSGKWSGGLVVSGGLAAPNWPIWGVTGGPKLGPLGGHHVIKRITSLLQHTRTISTCR